MNKKQQKKIRKKNRIQMRLHRRNQLPVVSAVKFLAAAAAVAVMLTRTAVLCNMDEPAVITRVPPKEEIQEEALPWQIDPEKPMIALTFDDGPRSSVTDRILKSLAEAGGRATFFMLGSRVASYENSVNQMVAQGCQVGNHTFGHKYITKLSQEELQAELGGTNQAVIAACGISPMVMRPPGGKTDETSLASLASMGMTPGQIYYRFSP